MTPDRNDRRSRPATTAWARAPIWARDEATVQDWTEADGGRPTLPDETADGLDATDEEIRHQAEDLPLDSFGRTR